jgi:hypothetical protein
MVYVRINSFGKNFKTDRSPLQPYSPLRPKKVYYEDFDYENYENYENFYSNYYINMEENIEQKTKDFLNSLNNKSEEKNDCKNHQEVIEVDTFGNLHPLNSTQKNVIINNNAFNGDSEDETDGSIEELDENLSEFSFEDLNEVSDIESVATTDDTNTEWRLI